MSDILEMLAKVDKDIDERAAERQKKISEIKQRIEGRKETIAIEEKALQEAEKERNGKEVAKHSQVIEPEKRFLHLDNAELLKAENEPLFSLDECKNRVSEIVEESNRLEKEAMEKIQKTLNQIKDIEKEIEVIISQCDETLQRLETESGLTKSGMRSVYNDLNFQERPNWNRINYFFDSIRQLPGVTS